MLQRLYYAYLQRPLQAWSYVSVTASKCLFLLSYTPLGSPLKDSECLRRIFWSCFILERYALGCLAILSRTVRRSGKPANET